MTSIHNKKNLRGQHNNHQIKGMKIKLKKKISVHNFLFFLTSIHNKKNKVKIERATQ